MPKSDALANAITSVKSGLDELEVAIRGRFTEESPEFTVGDTAEFLTISGAYEAATDEDKVAHIQLSRDYHPEEEDYPIEFYGDSDRNWFPVRLEGRGQGVSTIGHSEVESDVIRVHAPREGGHMAYANPFTARDFSVRGGNGNSQIRIGGMPNGVLENIILEGVGHGVHWDGTWEEMKTDNDGDEITSHSFGWRVTNVEAWGCKIGFLTEPWAGAHSTEFTGCKANACRSRGLLFQNAANCKWRGGALQLNMAFGASIRNCQSFSLRDAYIEGNGRGRDFPIELYARDADGLLIDGVRFHGINPRSVKHNYDWVQRAINIHDSVGVGITNCLGLRYGEGMISLMNDTEAEVNNIVAPDDNAPIFGYVTNDSTITGTSAKAAD